MTTYILHHLEGLLDIPMSTLILISVLCSAAMYFIRGHLVNPAMVFILGPINIIFSALANYALTKLEYFPLNKTDQWLICTIFSATIGIIVGLGLMALVLHQFDRSQAKSSRFHRA